MSKDNIAQQYNNMVASIEDAKIYDGRGEYNLYECNKCNNYKVTLYKDKGVTPFIMRCKCGGDMMHTKSSKQPPWVSVKERLPNENEDIIILCKHGAIFNGTYSNNVWFCMDGYIHDMYKGNPIYSSMSSIPSSWEPIAWMPRPKFEE